MKKLITVCLTLLGAAAGSVSGQTMDRHQLNQLQEEATVCAVFYDVSGTCIGAGDPQLAARYSQTSSAMLMGAMHVGRSIGMTDEAISSRYALAFRRIREDMRSDCVNISIIINRHAQACRNLAAGTLSNR